MLEQEIKSAMQFLIEAAGGPKPYYDSVPQDFIVPAVFFPQPDLETRGDTLRTYALQFRWFVKFFGRDTPSAHALGLAALKALQYRRNLVPLIDDTGALAGRGFRLQDPGLRVLDVGAVQLTLRWDSPRPYFEAPSEKMMVRSLNLYAKRAFDGAVTQNGG